MTQARTIRGLIGLTAKGEAAVADYRAFLQQLAAADGPPRASAALRDRLGRVGLRSGASLEDASAGRVRALVERYRDKLVQERALMIARTETLTAAHQGQQIAWEAAAAEGLLPPGQGRTWLVTDDERLCPDVCEPMDGVTVGLNEPWQVPGVGAVDIPQEAHPQCRCTMILQEAG